MPPYHLYILRCNDNSLYTGVTLDIEKRLIKHNSGKGAKYTASRRPVQLVYSEKCKDKGAALKREIEIKKWSKAKKEKLLKQK